MGFSNCKYKPTYNLDRVGPCLPLTTNNTAKLDDVLQKRTVLTKASPRGHFCCDLQRKAMTKSPP